MNQQDTTQQQHTPKQQHHHHKKKNWFLRKHFPNWFPCVLIAAIFGIVLFYKSLGSIDDIKKNAFNSQKLQVLKNKQLPVSSIKNQTGSPIDLSLIYFYQLSESDTNIIECPVSIPASKKNLKEDGNLSFDNLDFSFCKEWKGQCVFAFIEYTKEGNDKEKFYYQVTPEKISKSIINIK